MVIGALKTKDKIFHRPGCPYVKKIRPSNAFYFENKVIARECGYRHCIHCSTIYHMYSSDKSRIDNYAKSSGLSIRIYDDALYIEHNIESSWKIVPTINKNHDDIILYHANTESFNKLDRDREGHVIRHYHLQNYKSKHEIYSMLEYIIEHDEWKRNHEKECKRYTKHGSKKKKKASRKEIRSIEKTKITNVYNLIDQLSYERKHNKEK